MWKNNISNAEKYNLFESFVKQSSDYYGYKYNSSIDIVEFKFLDEYLDHIIDTNPKYKNFKMEQRERDLDRLLKG